MQTREFVSQMPKRKATNQGFHKYAEFWNMINWSDEREYSVTDEMTYYWITVKIFLTGV